MTRRRRFKSSTPKIEIFPFVIRILLMLLLYQVQYPCKVRSFIMGLIYSVDPTLLKIFSVGLRNHSRSDFYASKTGRSLTPTLDLDSQIARPRHRVSDLMRSVV